MDYSQKARLIFDGAVCHTFEAGTGYLGMAGNFLEPPLRLGSGIPDFVNAHLSTKESKRIGLNARNVTGMCSIARVVVELDYSEFSGGGRSMLFIVANGTAVRLK